MSMIQGNKSFTLLAAMLFHKTSNGVVAARVFMLITQSFEQPHGRMTLLRRSGFIRLQDLPNAIQHRSEFGKTLSFPPPIFLRLTATSQDFTHFVPRMMELTGNLTNAHSVTMSTTYPTVFVHCQHS